MTFNQNVPISLMSVLYDFMLCTEVTKIMNLHFLRLLLDH